MRRRLAFVLVAAYAPMAVGQSVVPIQVNGPSSNRVDMVFLGDGYTEAELDVYASDVDNAVQTLLMEPPFEDYQNYLNIRRIDVVSAESGADHPTEDIFRDTALGAAYSCAGIQRLLCVDSGLVNSILDASVTLDERDLVFVLVNDPQFGGSGGAISVTSTTSGFPHVLLHELGHTFGHLADEYETNPPPCNATVEPAAVNLTLEVDRNLIKWNTGGGPPTGWIEPETPVPTQSAEAGEGAGLFDGGGYCGPGEGIYRPTFISKMRSNAAPFGPVNEEQLVKRIYDYVYQVESQLPAESVLFMPHGSGRTFSISTVHPSTHPLQTYWYLDLALIETGGESFELTSAQLSPGPHQVFVWAHDDSPKVRNDPGDQMWGYAIWTVYVTTEDDSDGDGVSNAEDALPEDPTEQSDFDGDLVGDNADPDDDSDGVPDGSDAFPYDPMEWQDSDGDGIGDNADEASDSQIALFGIDRISPGLSVVRKSTGLEQVYSPLRLEGESIVSATGLAADPVSFDVYAAVGLAGQEASQRFLIRVNPNTGRSVLIGNTGQLIVALTFDDDGVLFGISDDCLGGCGAAAIPETLFRIDPETANATPELALGNGNDGEAAAFNRHSGLVHHLSGRGEEMVFETVDMQSGTVTNVPLSGDSLQNRIVQGVAYDVLEREFVGALLDPDLGEGDFVSISVDGAVSVVNALEFPWKDFTFWNLERAPRTDIDGDGFPDFVDAFPTDDGEWQDNDGDGVGNNADAFPTDETESADADGDGIGDNADTDDDNDGFEDTVDAFPFDPAEWVDTDGDGFGDNGDAFPEDSTEWLDTDGDGTGDNADEDDDNDGVADALDDYPLGQFDDVPPDYWSFFFVEALARAGVTSGCGGSDYCPEDPVNRAQMAVFLERGMNGSGFVPPAAAGNVFLDVAADDFAAAFIEQLYADGVTGGCGNGNYCPEAPVTRAQMAIFLLRAKHGAAYSPPSADGAFDDVDAEYWAAAWIEQLAAEGITAGCGGGAYCPEASVTRAQMAVFLVRTFAL